METNEKAKGERRGGKQKKNRKETARQNIENR